MKPILKLSFSKAVRGQVVVRLNGYIIHSTACSSGVREEGFRPGHRYEGRIDKLYHLQRGVAYRDKKSHGRFRTFFVVKKQTGHSNFTLGGYYLPPGLIDRIFGNGFALEALRSELHDRAAFVRETLYTTLRRVSKSLPVGRPRLARRSRRG